MEEDFDRFQDELTEAINKAKASGLDAGVVAALAVDKAVNLTFDVSTKPEYAFRIIIGILKEKLDEVTHDPGRN